jgi:hypothetical protein
MSNKIAKYGLDWTPETDDLQKEFYMIRRGGKWQGERGEIGLGLFEHYKRAMTLIWPEDDWHRWAELSLQEQIQNTITGMMGPASSNKTYSGAKFALTDYWVFPENTCTLVSSTDVRGLELRVWGKIKDLYNRGRERFDYLPGTVLESIHAIATDDIEEDDRARVLTRGIICIPCLQSGRYVGLGKYVGIKQKRVRLFADECQLMGITFLDSVSNLKNNPDFKGVFMGNPIDPMDPLGMICEPESGWTSLAEPTKTTTWDTKYPGGRCINFVGTDSPNNDFPQDQPPRYPYMINRKSIDEVEAFWSKDSQQYYSQAVGVMKTGLLERRVITRDLCVQHRALEKAVWGSGERKKYYAVDAAYSGTGGDRCIGGSIEVGNDLEGRQIIKVNPPKLIPVNIRGDKIPEDQIAEFVKRDMDQEGILVENGFYDSTGRGTLGSAFARVFGSSVPVPIEFGGKPTRRPVRHDLFIVDEQTKQRRHKRCDEHYYDFVSELWMTSRYVIESDQLRELPDDVMREGCQREYGTAAGNKYFVESKHDKKARERMKVSPDLYDWLVTAIEGARRRGFILQKLGVIMIENDSDKWLDERRRKLEKLYGSKRLNYAT